MFRAGSKEVDIVTELVPLANGSTTTISNTPEQDSKVAGRDTQEGHLENDDTPALKSAWRFIVKSGALAGGLVFLVNLVTLVVIYTRFDVEDSTAVVYEGDCEVTNRVSIASHVLINVLSTILLAYSNYGMQCISSPSRSELDRAHSKRRWLSIGVPNVRNLFFLSRGKSTLWLLLCLSSFPLHLFWNATVFQTQMSNEYIAVSVTPSFLQGQQPFLENTDYGSLNTSKALYIYTLQDEISTNTSNTTLHYLDVESCIHAYSTETLTKWRNLILVVDPVNVSTSSNTSVLAIYDSLGQQGENDFAQLGTWPFAWMCDSATYDINSFTNGGAWSCIKDLSSSRQWIPGQSPAATVLYGAQDGNPVSYCYAEAAPFQRCKVNVVPTFLIIVMVCNVVKIIGFVLCLRATKRSPPLVTTGDAVSSFLDRPDNYTTGRCLVSKYDYDKGWIHRSKEWQPRHVSAADVWDGGRYRWGKAIRARQWTFYMLLVSTAIILAGSFYGPNGLGNGTTESWPVILQLGIGKPHSNYELDSDNQVPIISGFLSANIPQLVVSYLYLGASNMLTTMTAMAEWTSYGQLKNPRGLRVSTPQKDTAQRSQYFLSLPYRYAVPMMTCVTMVHYFVSEMVFLAQIDVYDFEGNIDYSSSTTQIFFSPLAMLLAVSMGSFIIIGIIVIGIFKRYPGNIPLAGCCSASIAAACQPGLGQDRLKEGLALDKVRWGVVESDCRGVGHATFAGEHDFVQGLRKGGGYA